MGVLKSIENKPSILSKPNVVDVVGRKSVKQNNEQELTSKRIRSNNKDDQKMITS